MKMFRERNPLPLGLVVIVWLVATILVVLNINGIVGAFGRHYSVLLPEAAGLVQGDPVRVSGLHVGRVGTIKLDGPGVLVDFSITDPHVELGDLTSAQVSVETVLGDKALVLTSAGSGTLAADATIPMSRASVPYDVNDALSDLQRTTSKIDVPRVADALTTVADTVKGSTPELRSALLGVSRISATVASRDTALRSLLGNANRFSRILSDRSGDLTRLVKDGNVFFAALLQRRQDIASLLVNVRAMATQLDGLVTDNDKTLAPALNGLNRVLGTLQHNKANLGQALRGLSVYVTGLGEVVGSGPFFTAYLQNVLPGNMLTPTINPRPAYSRYLAPALGGSNG
ncbi:MCE family protein [Nocardioides ultimimeridianus]